MNQTINIDVHPYIEYDDNANVVYLTGDTFTGNCDDPISGKTEFSSVLSDYIDAHICPDGTISLGDRKYLLEMFRVIKQEARNAITVVKSFKVKR